jgi:hypothetical protein
VSKLLVVTAVVFLALAPAAEAALSVDRARSAIRAKVKRDGKLIRSDRVWQTAAVACKRRTRRTVSCYGEGEFSGLDCYYYGGRFLATRGRNGRVRVRDSVEPPRPRFHDFPVVLSPYCY